MPSLGGSGQYGGDDPTGGYSGGSFSDGGSFDSSAAHKSANRSIGIGGSGAGHPSGGQEVGLNIGNFFGGTMEQLTNLTAPTDLAKSLASGVPQEQPTFFGPAGDMFSDSFGIPEKETPLESESLLDNIGTSIKEFLGIGDDEDDPIVDATPGPSDITAPLHEYNAMAVLDDWTPGKPLDESDLDTLVSAYKKHEINKRGLLGQIFGVGVDDPKNFKENLTEKLMSLVFSPIGMSGPLPAVDPIGKVVGGMISNSIRNDRIDRGVIDPQLKALGFDDKQIDKSWRSYHDTGDVAQGEGQNESEYLDINTDYIDEETGKTISNPYYIFRYGEQYTEEEPDNGSALNGPLKGTALRKTGDEEEENTLGNRLLLDIFADDLLENLEVW